MDVVAAVIKKKDKYLIVQRNKNKYLGLKWEFPGGKVEKGESLEDAVKREIKEELSIKINVIKKIGEEYYKDEKIDIKIYYFECFHSSGKIFLNEHEGYRWLLKEKINGYDLVEADSKITKKLL